MSPLPLSQVPPPVLRELTRPWAPARGSLVVVAVSGGADSVALLLVLAGLAPGRGWDLAVATLDHGLRGEAGAADRRFVEDLAAELSLPVDAGRHPVDPTAGASPESAARDVRRAFLEEVATRRGAAAIALGHTLDDQAETVLFRLARGAGARGLSAMARWSPPYWRPLLGVRRPLLRRLLVRAGQAWREDATNAGPAAARNRVRRLLPALEAALGPGALAGVARAADLLRDDESLLEQLAGERGAGAILDRSPDRVVLARRALADLPPALSRRILRASLEALAGPGFGAVHLVALQRLATGGHGRFADLPAGLVARREPGRLVLERKEHREAAGARDPLSRGHDPAPGH
ncbi:MAG: tRNA lysidine(34) synthetase TilS [Acidobacteria bacterium]|nr:tRNA lysidine(34) synthetase TilS [Acidobacteriota bacterium]